MNDPNLPRPDERSGERGVALIMAILFTIIVLGITVTGSLILKAHQEKTKLSFVSKGQAMQFARSGLIEALGWFRKQTAQPVTDFEPVLDTAAVPPVLDTIDPDIGIVREFQITNSIWGRYEVWKEWAADPDATRLAFRQQMQVEDISAIRGNLSPGSVWRIRSLGYVFRMVDDTVPFNQAPNQVLGQELADVETRRLALQPPGQAAVCCRNGSAITIGTRGRVEGGTGAAGLYYLTGTGSPSVSGTGATLTGAPGQSAAPAYDDGFDAVFGVSREDLSAMADYVVDSPNDFPSPVPVDTVVFSNIGMTFDSARPLSGTGVVVVNGNVLVDQGSYSSFSGLLYVDGNLTLREPCSVQGAIVVTGTVTVLGSSDFASVAYDDSILQRLRQELGTYRLSSALARPRSSDR